MNLEYVRMAIESLLANKVRTLLSMLGIIIGVSTVIIVVGIGLGAQAQIAEQYKNMSVESIIVRAGGSQGGPNQSSSNSKLSVKDVDYVLSRTKLIKDGTAVVQGSQTASYASQSSSFTVIGAQAAFLDISNLAIGSGRDLTPAEYAGEGFVAIIGSDVATSLFTDGSSPVGKTIALGGKQFTVVGVLKANGATSRIASYDESIYVPYATAKNRLLGSQGRLTITFRATSVGVLAEAMTELSALLRDSHKLALTASDDFSAFNAGSIVSSAQSSAQTMTVLLTSVAAVVLVVSGIGIMNVMFVTVAERTKEIGILKAIGAPQWSILAQFLLEAIFLTIFGGILGIAAGEWSIPLLNKLDGWYVLPSLEGAVIAFCFSVGVGIFFGFYPALKASRLDPVDALRSE